MSRSWGTKEHTWGTINPCLVEVRCRCMGIKGQA